jgi:hypothetical protein
LGQRCILRLDKAVLGGVECIPFHRR